MYSNLFFLKISSKSSNSWQYDGSTTHINPVHPLIFVFKFILPKNIFKIKQFMAI
jgi:hypothetical protein